MKNEIKSNESKEFTNTSAENFKSIKPEKEMTSNEVSDFWKNEFNDMAEQAKTETENKSESNVENQKNNIETRDISEITNNYIEDLKTKSDCPETIPSDILDSSKMELQNPEDVAKKREEFDDKKAKLRAEWEKQNNMEWPKYKEDILNEDEVVIRKAGDYYDAHHIIPLKLGGENVASNITPLDMNSHKDIHSKNGSCKALVDSFKGGN